MLLGNNKLNIAFLGIVFLNVCQSLKMLQGSGHALYIQITLLEKQSNLALSCILIKN